MAAGVVGLGRTWAVQAGVSLVMMSVACQNGDPPRPSEPAASALPVGAAPAPPAAPAAPSTAPPTASSGDGSLAFFRVQGVAADDVLNIRSNPDSSSPSLGTLPAGATHVEGIGAPSVVGAARWQRVRHGGTLGWVNARFLSPHENAEPARPPGGAKPASFALLAPLICFGTEPFWAIRFGADGSASYEAMGEVPSSSSIAQLRSNPSGDPESFDLVTAGRGMYLRAAMRKTGRCSDGMSDLLHPYEFTAVGTPGALSGCCRLEQASPGEPRP
jgi:uncharacterized membrane protein